MNEQKAGCKYKIVIEVEHIRNGKVINYEKNETIQEIKRNNNGCTNTK